jgi:hypothetical protein
MRTNYLAEAWNRRFKAVIQCDHPFLWIFIHSLQKEEHYSESLKSLILSPHPTLLTQIKGLAMNL